MNEYEKKLKDNVQERRSVNIDRYGMDVGAVIQELQDQSVGLIDPQLEIDVDTYYESTSLIFTITGWRPKTEAEYAAEAAKKALDKENARKSKEQQARAEWTLAKNLYTKYKDKLQENDGS